MEDNTRIYDRSAQEEAFRLDDVLEPYNPMEEPQPQPMEGENYPEDEEPYEDYGDYEEYDEYAQYVGEAPEEYYGDDDYSDEHEEMDREGKVRTAMGLFNSISVLAGVFVILILLAMLVSLGSWLRRDILHSLTLLQGGIQ